jgi:hydroxymethylglutaryl-CoA lyase
VSHSNVARRVEIIEVSPRDGLQAHPDPVPTALKIELIQRLVDAGVRRMEFASFVHPGKVPQMADADVVAASLNHSMGCTFTGLVLNNRGFERALAAGCREIGMVVIASDTFSRRNQGIGTDEALAAWLRIARAAHLAGVRAQLTISAACGCPYEGEVPVGRVVDLAVRAAAGEPCEIAVADTIGAGVPSQVTDIFNGIREALPEVPLRGHFHNTRNTGFANAFAALAAGVSRLDASCGGLGGCPFAPGATGNIATEDLLYMLQRSGYATGISLPSMIATAAWLEQQLGRPLPAAMLRAAEFPRARPLPEDGLRDQSEALHSAP